MITSLRFPAILVFVLLFSLVACSSSQENIIAEPTFIRLSPVSPPDTPYEEPERPADPTREIWHPGYWSYDGADFHWESGFLMARPNPTSVWSPDHWEKRTYGFAFVKGYWQ